MSMQDPWLLPEDGIVDLIAVDVAAHGYRRVRLTWQERFLAEQRIRAEGGTDEDVRDRLSLPALRAVA